MMACTLNRAGLGLLGLALLAGCGHGKTDVLGDPAAGRVIITRQACGSCHVIPGIDQADGLVGPPLADFAHQRIIAGVLPNSPDALIRFLRAPQSVVKGGAMPDMGLTEAQAQHVAAYLYRLK